MRIMFVIPSLLTGGAERVASILTNKWALGGNDVFIITFGNESTLPFYEINQNIDIQNINLRCNRRKIFEFPIINIKRIKKLIQLNKNIKPDVVVSFMTEANVVSILAAKWLNIPIIISERIHPKYHAIGDLRKLIRDTIYPHANALVVQTNEIAEYIKATTNIHSHVIPNPIEIERFEKKNNYHLSVGDNPEIKKIIVSVGRLDLQKGYDILIKAFANIHAYYPDWHLMIYGEGQQRKNLELLIKNYELENTIFLPGISNEIPAILSNASLFVLPSRYEGYPNVLIEALAAKCCVIATDCPGGSKEILERGKYGVLISPDSIEELTDVLSELMSSDNLRQEYEHKSFEAISGLDAEIISENWIRLLKSVTS